jgi:hypothetical protein
MIITDLLETGICHNSSSYTKGKVQGTQYAPLQIKTSTVEPRSIIPATIVFLHVPFTIFGPK